MAAKEISEIPGQNYKVTAIAFSANIPVERSQRLEPLYGRYFEDIPASELVGRFGKVESAIEVWGVLAYSKRITKALEKLHQIMEEGGELLVFLGSSDPRPFQKKSRVLVADSMYASEVIDENGRNLPLPDFIKSHIRGLDVSLIGVNQRSAVMRLKKNKDSFWFPKLQFLGIYSDPGLREQFSFQTDLNVDRMPPPRLFKVINQ